MIDVGLDLSTLADSNTVSEVADVLRVSSKTVYRMIMSEEIGYLKVLGGYRITRKHFEDFLQKNTHEPVQRKETA
jgi:excisionase family DNA binding protein